MLRKSTTQCGHGFDVDKYCKVIMSLFYSFHGNCSDGATVPSSLHFPMTHDGRAEMEVRGPRGALSLMDRQSGFSI